MIGRHFLCSDTTFAVHIGRYPGIGPKTCDMFQVYSSQYSLRRKSTIEDIKFENELIRHQGIIYHDVPKTKRVTFELSSLQLIQNFWYVFLLYLGEMHCQ